MAKEICHIADSFGIIRPEGRPVMASPLSFSSSTATNVGWSIGLSGTEGLSSWMDAIGRGFEATAWRALQQRMELPAEDLAAWLGTSARTLKRRETAGRLTAEESDRLFRLARLFERTVEVMGSEAMAREWLRSEQHALGGRVPLRIARYEPGAREVERLLGRVEHGIPV